ncbi:MAG: hypothetical protein R2746_14775 [Acidimicrobiales bacterium]
MTQTSGARQELVTPTVREESTLTVDGVDDGEAMVSLAFTEANVVRTDTDLTDQEAAELDAALAALVGIRPRPRHRAGEVSSFRYDLPDDLDPAVATTLDAPATSSTPPWCRSRASPWAWAPGGAPPPPAGWAGSRCGRRPPTS